MKRRTFQILLGGLLLAAGGVFRLGAQSFQEFAPVKVEVYAPREIAPSFEDEASPEPAKPPNHYPVDEETWKAHKEEAARFEGAPEPDSIVEVQEDQQAAVTTMFLGIPYNGATPPDTTLGKSPQRILTAVNNQISLYDNAGTLLQNKSLQSFFFGLAESFPPFDPRVLYDRLGPNSRFYVLASQYRAVPTPASFIHLAVSRSPNPTNLEATGWCIYGLSTLSDFATIHKTYADYPMMGVGADTLTVSANFMTITGSAFTYAILRSFDKLGLSSNAAACPIATAQLFRPATMSGDLSKISLQPVTHYTAPSSFAGTTNPAYLVNTKYPSGNFYRVWRVRNILSGAAPGNLQSVDVSTPDYFNPPEAAQPGSASTDVYLRTGDSRVISAAGLGDAVWLSHTVLCNSGGDPPESCIKVARLSFSQAAAGLPSALVTQQTTFGGGANVFYYMPGIAVNQNERTVVPFLYSSTTTPLSSAWTLKNLATTAYPAATAFTSGSCSRAGDGTQPRTGDYVGAQTDHGLLSFWIGAEHAVVSPPAAGVCTWRTALRDVQ